MDFLPELVWSKILIKTFKVNSTPLTSNQHFIFRIIFSMSTPGSNYYFLLNLIMKLLMMNRNYPEPAKMMSLVSLLFGNTLIRKIGLRQSFQFHRQNNNKNASY